MRKRKKGGDVAQFKDYILLVIYAGDLEVIGDVAQFKDYLFI